MHLSSAVQCAERACAVLAALRECGDCAGDCPAVAAARPPDCPHRPRVLRLCRARVLDEALRTGVPPLSRAPALGDDVAREVLTRTSTCRRAR